MKITEMTQDAQGFAFFLFIFLGSLLIVGGMALLKHQRRHRARRSKRQKGGSK